MPKILSKDSQAVLPQFSLPLKKEEVAESFDTTFKAVTKKNHKFQNTPERKHQEPKDTKPDAKADLEKIEEQKKASIPLDFPSKRVDMFFSENNYDEENLTDLNLEFMDFLEPILNAETSAPIENTPINLSKENEMAVILKDGLQTLCKFPSETTSQSIFSDENTFIQKPELDVSPITIINESRIQLIEESDQGKLEEKLEESILITDGISTQIDLKPFQPYHRNIYVADTPAEEELLQPVIEPIILKGMFPILPNKNQSIPNEGVQLPEKLEKNANFEMHVDVQRSNTVVISKPFVFETFIPQTESKEEAPQSAIEVKKTAESFMQLATDAKPLSLEKTEIHTLNGEFLQTVKEQFEKFQRSNDKKITVQMRANGKNLTIIFNSVGDDQINILFRTTDKDWQSLLHHSRDEIAKLLSRETIDIRYLGE